MGSVNRKRYFQQIEEIVGLIRSTHVFSDISEAAKKRRRERARVDKEYFFKTYLPHYFSKPFSKMHREIMGYLETRVVPVAVAAPRGHGKSTLVSFGDPLHKILYNTRNFLVLVSDTKDQAINFVQRIRLELEYNERILCDFGDLRGSLQWTDEDFITKDGVRVLARGAGQKIRGLVHRQYRPDHIIIDDLENDEIVRNPRRVKRLLNWVLETVYPALSPSGSLFVIGTLLARRSVLAQLLERDYWIHRIYRAIENGKPLWPEMYSMETLMRKKELIGSLAFQKEWMNDPRDEEGDFRPEWFRYYTDSDIEGRVLRVFTAIDPSLGSGEGNDYKAIVTVGIDEHGYIYVLDAWIKRKSIDAMIEAAYEIYARYNPTIIGLETTAWQKLLFRDFARAAEEHGFHLPIRGIDNTVNKEMRIRRLSPLVERGIIRFREEQKELLEELEFFPSATVHDDGPDALEMAVRLAESGGKIEIRTGRRKRAYRRYVNGY